MYFSLKRVHDAEKDTQNYTKIQKYRFLSVYISVPASPIISRDRPDSGDFFLFNRDHHIKDKNQDRGE